MEQAIIEIELIRHENRKENYELSAAAQRCEDRQGYYRVGTEYLDRLKSCCDLTKKPAGLKAGGFAIGGQEPCPTDV